MALPKKGTRKIEVQGKVYRWMVGKVYHGRGTKFADVVIESPDGKIFKHQECVRVGEDEDDLGDYHIPITPDHVRKLIEGNNL